MKVIIVALAFVAVAAAAAIEGEPDIKILRSENTQTPEGGYNFGFETENGITRSEDGQVKTVQNDENKPQDVVVVSGSWSYTDPKGIIETINYYADETGYHAEGPSVPKVASRR